MKEKKTILKEAGVLLIAVAMIFSAFAVSAESIKPTLSSKAKILPSMIKSNVNNRDDIVWDNGGIDGNQNGLSSQLDLAYPFNSQVADDFMFEEETFVTDVHWWGVFWNGPPAGPNPADFNIIFYADAGGMPTGAGMPDPTPTALVVYNMPQVMGVPTGGTEEYEYEVVLPQPFVAAANEHYWIAIQWVGNFQPQWGWDTNGNNPELLALSVQGFPLLGTVYWTIHGYGDMAFYLTGYVGQPPVPDLDCEGSLSWTDVPAGSTVTGTFEVKNIGEPGSLLNWEITSWPDWGTWTFDPSSGTGLAAGDSTTVTATCISPKLPYVLNLLLQENEYTGNIVATNTDDPSDTDTVTVTLVTPVNEPGIQGSQQSQNHLLVRVLRLYLNANKLIHYT